ncbi:MAG TPA: translation initiation factor IF-2 [Candidatus Saccharimonadales bacterium]|nr:translation initiation factor IF-2 [Candidatus Saccharimonadales bacterium]
MSRTVQIEDGLTVGTLAEKLEVPVTNLIAELMKNGVLATVNERIDFDTAAIIASEIDPEVELKKQEAQEDIPRKKQKKTTKGESRPPVVAVMGHVDHGKTSLLDAICDTKVATGEAGGITQHISAYQAKHNDRLITFLDTPGHEAFAAIREHGAHLTDLVIIVVAADDGIKPQTSEAIRFAKKAGVKILVAINKIDKEGADPNRVKQQLSENGLMPEEWGGDTVCVEVSAKTGDGIDKLLEMILLISDVEELKAEVSIPAEGLIIEAHMEQGRGPVGVALVEQGTLKKGDFVVAGTTYAKVRNLESSDGTSVNKAGPSTPVRLTGFKALPRFGDEFKVVSDEKTARRQVEVNSRQASGENKDTLTSGDLIRIIDRQRQVSELNLIVKADVQGSLKSVIDGLKALNTDEVAVRIVGFGIGNVTEKDEHLASTSGAIIYGFNIDMPSNIRQLANRDKVSVRMFKVIYELIDDTKQELEKLLPAEIVRTDVGRLLVKGVFKITKTEVICGGEVTKGKLTVPALANAYRDDETIAENLEILSLKHGPQETKEVQAGEMCGVSFKSESRVDIKEGDRLEFFTIEEKVRKLQE